MKAEAAGDRIERLPVSRKLRGPVSVPYALSFKARAGDAGAGAVQALIVPEVFPGGVRQGRVGEVEIPDIPFRFIADVIAGMVALALTEKHQFEAKPFTGGIRHIAGVIPPLGAKVFVFKMIAGKLVAIAGQSFPVSKAAAEDGCPSGYDKE